MLALTRPPHFAACLAASALALAACSGGHNDEPSPDAGPADGDDAAVGEPIAWEQDDAPSGAALWIDAHPDATALDVTVSSRGLGEVFGLSAHLVWDARVLSVDAAVAAEGQVAILDPEGDSSAIMLASSRAPGDLALGGSRVSREAGTVELDAETVLAHVRLAIVGAGTTRVDLSRAVVARQDGALSPLAVGGGALVVQEVTP